MPRSRPDGRVERGQSLSSAFSARQWNRMCDATDQVLGDRYGVAGGPLGQSGGAANVVLIRNDSGTAVVRFGVLGISGVAINPASSAANAAQFAERPVLIGVTPTTASHRERFVVAMEPIANGAIGRAAVSGVFPCKVNIINVNHQFADVRNGDQSQLDSAACGVCQLLWKDSGTGSSKWALGCM